MFQRMIPKVGVENTPILQFIMYVSATAYTHDIAVSGYKTMYLSGNWINPYGSYCSYMRMRSDGTSIDGSYRGISSVIPLTDDTVFVRFRSYYTSTGTFSCQYRLTVD